MHAESLDTWRHEHAFLGEHHARNERRSWAVVLLCAAMMLAEIVAGGVFVAEAVSVLLQVWVYRWRKRRHGKEYADAHRVFRMAPLHHHFEKLGWAEPQVVMRFYILGVMCAAIALATLKVR